MKLINIFFMLITISQVSYANIDRSIFRKDTVIVKRYEMMGDLTSVPNFIQDYQLYITGDSFIIKTPSRFTDEDIYFNKLITPDMVGYGGMRIDSLYLIDDFFPKYVYTTIYSKTGERYYNTEKSKITNAEIYKPNFFVFYFFYLDEYRNSKSYYPKFYQGIKNMLANIDYIPFFPNDSKILYYKNSHIISPFVEFVYQGDTLRALMFEFSHSEFMTENLKYYYITPESLSNPGPKYGIYEGASYMTSGIVFLEYNSGLPIFLLAKNIERSGISGFKEKYIVYKIDDLVIPEFSIEDLIQEIPLDINNENNK